MNLHKLYSIELTMGPKHGLLVFRKTQCMSLIRNWYSVLGQTNPGVARYKLAQNFDVCN